MTGLFLFLTQLTQLIKPELIINLYYFNTHN